MTTKLALLQLSIFSKVPYHSVSWSLHKSVSDYYRKWQSHDRSQNSIYHGTEYILVSYPPKHPQRQVRLPENFFGCKAWWHIINMKEIIYIYIHISIFYMLILGLMVHIHYSLNHNLLKHRHEVFCLFLCQTVYPIKYAHTRFLLCCSYIVVGTCSGIICICIHLYSLGLLHWHWGNRKIAPVSVKGSWRIWVKLVAT